MTEEIEVALGRALAAAGSRDVFVAGGASIARQALATGLADELHVQSRRSVIDSPAVTHLRYRIRADQADG